MGLPFVEMDVAMVEAASRYVRVSTSHHRPAPAMEETWSRFFVSCDATIKALISRQGVQGDEVDDCAQDVWLALLEWLSGFNYRPDRAKFSTFLYTVVRNKTIDRHRKSSTHKAHLGKSYRWMPTPSDSELQDYDTVENSDFVDTAMQRLSDHTTSVNCDLARMRWLEGSSVSETADALGLTRDQIWAREHRLRKKMQNILIRVLREET